MKRVTPMQRSLKNLRERGYKAEKVEQRLPIPGKFVTRDLFNFIDIIAIQEGCMIIAVQTTSAAHFADHMEKIHAQPEFVIWKKAGGRVFLHAWGKRGARGERKTWTLREEEL